jgi:hypothetical protein
VLRFAWRREPAAAVLRHVQPDGEENTVSGAWRYASITSAAEEHNTGSRMLKIVGTYSGGAFTPTSAYATKKELLPTP